MKINALKQRIEGLNARSEKLNTARNQDIGKKNALQAQSEDLLKEYNRKYGTNLDIFGIEAEILKVVSEKEKAAAGLEALFKAVDEGDYARANELAGVTEGNKEVTENIEKIAQNGVIKPAKAEKPPKTAKVEIETTEKMLETAKVETRTAKIMPETAKSAKTEKPKKSKLTEEVVSAVKAVNVAESVEIEVDQVEIDFFAENAEIPDIENTEVEFSEIFLMKKIQHRLGRKKSLNKRKNRQLNKKKHQKKL